MPLPAFTILQALKAIGLGTGGMLTYKFFKDDEEDKKKKKPLYNIGGVSTKSQRAICNTGLDAATKKLYGCK